MHTLMQRLRDYMACDFRHGGYDNHMFTWHMYICGNDMLLYHDIRTQIYGHGTGLTLYQEPNAKKASAFLSFKHNHEE